MVVLFIGIAIKRELKKSNILGSGAIERGELSYSIASESSKSDERHVITRSINTVTPYVYTIKLY